jgi:hypothetical protein
MASSVSIIHTLLKKANETLIQMLNELNELNELIEDDLPLQMLSRANESLVIPRLISNVLINSIVVDC